jgi:hypothetical protein
MIAIINVDPDYTFTPPHPVLLCAFLLNFNPEFRSSPIFDLRKPDQQDSVSQFGGGVLHTDSPTQWNQPAKLAITPLRTEMREYSVSRLAALLLAPNSKLRICGPNPNLIGRQSRKLDTQNYCINSLTKINRRGPGVRRKWFFRDRSFLQSGEQSPHAIAKTLQFETFQAGCTSGFYHF